jgi:hypothetical protein
VCVQIVFPLIVPFVFPLKGLTSFLVFVPAFQAYDLFNVTWNTLSPGLYRRPRQVTPTPCTRLFPSPILNVLLRGRSSFSSSKARQARCRLDLVNSLAIANALLNGARTQSLDDDENAEERYLVLRSSV